MAYKTKAIILDCGVHAETWETNYKGEVKERISLSINDLYSGCDKMSDPAFMAKLFQELADKGYIIDCLDLDKGYYDSIDDIILRASRPKK